MHSHLSKEDRKAIAYFLTCSWNLTRIASVLQKHKSTISRELHRNTGPEEPYRYGYATQQYLQRRKKHKEYQYKIKYNTFLREHIETHLRAHDSPEQIAGRLRIEQGIILSHETIYRWIYKDRPDLQPYLRCQKGQWKRKRGTGKRTKQRRQDQFRSIETRPTIVSTRDRLGDWEGDTIIGKERTQRILTHVERRSGYGVGDLLLEVSAPIVEDMTVQRMETFPSQKRQTITYDRGTEFGGDDHVLEQRTNTTVYRAHAYHSWERGCNENWNGLLRYFFPKGTDFSILSQEDVERAVQNLNHRPRKRLNYLTPHEVFVLERDPSAVAFHTRI